MPLSFKEGDVSFLLKEGMDIKKVNSLVINTFVESALV
jgi:hypothetical protein